MNNLTVRSAPLPVAYLDARTALARCEKVDECQGWADKAAALASYARQSEDETLLKTARRIQARALERAAELLMQVKAAKGRRIGGGGSPNSRKAAAAAAGLSPDQAKTIVRIGAVPKDEREALIESDDPPTITALADLGTKRRIEPAPHREEWSDWVFGIKRLRDVPECGLDVLAHRDGGIPLSRLLSDACSARANIDEWISILEAMEEANVSDDVVEKSGVE
jgi:hypothetical protein